MQNTGSSVALKLNYQGRHSSRHTQSTEDKSQQRTTAAATLISI